MVYLQSLLCACLCPQAITYCVSEEHLSLCTALFLVVHMVKPHLFWSPEMVEASPSYRRFLKVSLEGDGGMLAFSSLYKIVYISLFNRPRLSAEMSVISNLFRYVFSTVSHSNATPQSRLSSSLGFSSSENVLLFPWNWWMRRVEHAHLPWKISLSPVHHGSKDSNFVRTLPWGGLSG